MPLWAIALTTGGTGMNDTREILRMQMPEFRRTTSGFSILMNSLVLFFFMGTLTAGETSSADPNVPASDAALNDALVQARKSVGTFWDQFRSVTCVEKVTQEKLGKHGKVDYSQKSIFDYLVLLNAGKDDLFVEESRLQQGKKNKEKNIPLLIANGLPTLILVFHPYYQEDFSYQLEGDEIVGGRRLVKVRFKHVPGTKSTTALRLRGRDYPLDIEGTAWLDPATGAIHRIEAGLATPMPEHNLKVLRMEVSYNQYEFPSVDGVSWLPSTATVNIETERQHWRNTHRYSSYKKFTVNTEEIVSR